MVKDIRISDFDYQLPDDRIALHPLAKRDACKLLVSRYSDEICHETFSALPSLVESGSLLVCNNTRVINARIKFEKETGSRIEVFLLEPVSPKDYVLSFQTRGKCRWSCMVGNLKRWKEHPLNKNVNINGKDVTLTAVRCRPLEGNAHEIEFSWNDESVNFASIIEAAGYIPIPPYLRRDSQDSDKDDYQTVYAEIKGSVAAPTAGLHFTEDVFAALHDRGVEIGNVTLHVGAGTFQPVKSEEIGQHPMHTEVFSVDRVMVMALIDAIESGREVTAVGTTTVRTLESLPYIGRHILKGEKAHVDQWEAYENAGLNMPDTITALKAILSYLDDNGADSLTASTSIMIAPGFEWRIVNAMVTNFHQPQSTLLLLVSSFLGDRGNSNPRWKKFYESALENDYRFLSYGDACYFKKG